MVLRARISSREDGTMDPTRIGNRRDPITDAAEISYRNGRTTSLWGWERDQGPATKRTKLKEHADGYHSGAREIRANGTITGRRRRSSV